MKEFREIPDGYASVYVVVPHEDVEGITREGLRVEKNRRRNIDDLPDEVRLVEKIFQEESASRGLPANRTNCIYAYPDDPSKRHIGMGFDPQHEVLLEVKVDPSELFVVDGERLTEAVARYHRGDRSIEGMRSWAEAYWDGRIPLSQFQKELADPDGSAQYKTFPEVLIPHNIEPKHIKIIS